MSTALPVNWAISFSFFKTLEVVSLGGVNIIRWFVRLACKQSTIYESVSLQQVTIKYAVLLHKSNQ